LADLDDEEDKMEEDCSEAQPDNVVTKFWKNLHDKDHNGQDKFMGEVLQLGTSLSPRTVDGPIDVLTNSLFRGQLREYQKLGLQWLKSVYEQNLSGILGDEKGLGKSVQLIAFIAHLASSKAGVWGPHLLVVPSYAMLEWDRLFKTWFPGMKVFLYFGNVKERRGLRRDWAHDRHHVLVTSYRVALRDIVWMQRWVITSGG
jgi:SNF2 family DNA or RNA helicase